MLCVTGYCRVEHYLTGTAEHHFPSQVHDAAVSWSILKVIASLVCLEFMGPTLIPTQDAPTT
jgi:hypothetical protein